ncbi:SurA N-terminal domain-containing protein [Massilia sp. TWR1-2-2]|uniref:SurA N-terminal domain-containing protein n=1 Tax=Massilia sp. TWR1-2-2 TaxID=2804584 RepID=UPI003CF4C1D9
MFEFIRTHKRFMQVLLMLLIVPSFVLVGVSSYENKGDDANAVANVDGQKITQQEWDNAQRNQMDRYRQMLGERFDQKMFETPEAKQAILDNLIAERALAAEMTRRHLTITDGTLAKVYAEQFNGDVNQYKQTAASLGLTTPGLDARVRRDMALAQISGAVQSTAFAPRSVTTRLSDINDQEREVQELIFPASQYILQVKVTDQMIKAFYDKNATMFQIPEQVKAEYLLFTPETVESQVAVTDAEVADFYAKNQKNFSTGELRAASHILINAKKDAPAAEKAAAQAKAEAILAQLRKNPAEFARLAKAESQDPGSAELGGDLGTVEKGAFVKPVEDAIYQLKQGEISNVVASEYGYHIITVTSLKPAAVKPLEEAKPAIAEELKKQKMSKKYSELAEAFSNTLYEQSDSLKPAADKFKLKVETIDSLTRTPSPALGAAPFNSAKFLAAIFSEDSLKNKRNTEAVQAGPNVLIAGRVIEFKPASKRPLAEVAAAIRERVTVEEAAKLARQAGEAKLAAAKASADATGFGEAKLVTRSKQPTINPAAAIAVLKADITKLPAYVGVDVPGQGYGVYRIGKVSQAAVPDAERRKAEVEQIGNALGQQDMYNYTEMLKQKAKVKVLVKPAGAVTAAK